VRHPNNEQEPRTGNRSRAHQLTMDDKLGGCEAEECAPAVSNPAPVAAADVAAGVGSTPTSLLMAATDARRGWESLSGCSKRDTLGGGALKPQAARQRCLMKASLVHSLSTARATQLSCTAPDRRRRAQTHSLSEACALLLPRCSAHARQGNRAAAPFACMPSHIVIHDVKECLVLPRLALNGVVQLKGLAQAWVWWHGAATRACRMAAAATHPHMSH
jgi:hypothetical protein